MLKLLALLLSLAPAQAAAQNFIQVPACGNTLPSSIKPSAPTIAMNPSGQVCIAGSFSATVPTPTVVIPSPLTITIYPSQVVSGAFADGALVTLGQVGEAAYRTVGASGDVIALLKGIFNNVITPISVSGSFSSTTTTVNINSITPTPLAVTMSSPINVTGNFSTGASPSSVVVLTSPIGVNIASSPINVTGNLQASVSSPLGVNIASSPVNVTMASPVNVTGNLTASVSSPLGVNIASSPVNVTLASPQDVIVNNGNPNGLTTMSSSSPVVIASDQTPVKVTVVTGINLATPLNVTLAASPLNVTGSFSAGASPQSSIIVTSPVAVTIASSPVNVTGSLSASVASPIGVNIAATTPISVIVGNDNPNGLATMANSSPVVVASDQTLNVNCTGCSAASVVTIQNIVASPISVAIATSSVNTTVVGSPQNVTVGTSPVAVTIASSPVNVTGNFTSTATGSNIVQLAGQTLASPTTYGIATTGSVQNVNAFVTSLPATPLNVTIASTPLNTTISNLASPQGVAVVNSPTVVLSGSPVSVGIAGPTPLNVTVGNPQTSGANTDLVQLAGQALASPTTYGIATTGSVQNVNAFVTSLPATPLNVTIAQTPINVTLAPSPINVTVGGITSPQNVTLAGPTPLNVTVGNLASPQGVALSGIGATLTPQNVTVANGNANGQAAMASSSPVVVASDNNVVMHLSLSRVASVISHTVTTAYGVTNVALGLGVTPGVTPGFAGSHQLAQTWCQGRTSVATPPVFFLQIFNNTATETTLGTTRAIALIAVSGTPVQVGSLPALLPPGINMTAISFALTQGPIGSSTAVGQSVDCTFVYN